MGNASLRSGIEQGEGKKCVVSEGVGGEGGDECVRKGALEGARCFFKVLGQPRGEPRTLDRIWVLAYQLPRSKQ